MKKFLLISFLFACSNSFSQTVIYQESFENGTPGWSLNTNDLNGVTSLTPNFWVINNSYLGGLIIIITVPDTPNEPSQVLGQPQSNYLHICSDLAQSNGITNCNYGAQGNHSYFARMDSAISTVGFTNDTLSFWWLCQGNSSAYGSVYYRTSSVGTWTNVMGTSTAGNLNLHNNWQLKKMYLPVFDNQPYLQFAFRFNHSNSGSDPAFAIDDVKLTGNSSVQPGPTPGFTVNDSVICQDRCITFSDTSTGTPNSWSWNFPGGTPNSSNSNMPIVCYHTAGTYNVTLTVSNANGTNSLTQNGYITVNANPNPPTILQNGNTLTCNPTSSLYQWFYNGSLLSGSTQQSYNAAVNGYYQVGITDINGCTALSDSFLFNFNSINFLNDEVIEIFPNPFYQNITLKNNSDLYFEWTLTDVTGKELLKGNSKNFITGINTDALNAGTYFIKIVSAEKMQVSKLIKQ